MGSWWPYIITMVFLGTYPVVGALLWIAGAAAFSYFREGDRADEAFYELERRPRVSVLIAAFDEELTIGRTLEAVTALDWPDLEVLVVDDGSQDRTGEIVREYTGDPRVNLLSLPSNGGKAGALNAGLPRLTSDYVLMMDADGAPAPDALHWMAAHLVRLPHVAAVTGNPRVANHRTLLSRLQSVEFSATVSVLRRAQTTWGRLMTFSGICTLARRDALYAVGGFQPEMATEDISMTWQLQAAGWQVRYEPRALFAMQVPETLGVWWRQRVRWARGMGQVLRRFGATPVSWSQRRLAAIWLESAVSALWAHAFLLLTVVWLVLALLDDTRWGANPIIAYWGMVIALVCIAQALLGVWLDRRYDPRIWRSLLWLPLFPLFYWLLLSAAAVRGTLPGALKRPSGPVTWHVQRTRVPD
jgi:biofilm PGA synthesis N-glycosyltransferase PgaC